MQNNMDEAAEESEKSPSYYAREAVKRQQALNALRNQRLNQDQRDPDEAGEMTIDEVNQR